MAVVKLERALVDVGTVEAVTRVAVGRARARVAARGVAAGSEAVARMCAERALIDVLTRDSVPFVAVEARAVERAG